IPAIEGLVIAIPIVALHRSLELATRDGFKHRLKRFRFLRPMNDRRQKRHARPGYNEADILPHMKGRSILISADVGVGRGKTMVWTCDLTHRNIEINGSYRS